MCCFETTSKYIWKHGFVLKGSRGSRIKWEAMGQGICPVPASVLPNYAILLASKPGDFGNIGKVYATGRQFFDPRGVLATIPPETSSNWDDENGGGVPSSHGARLIIHFRSGFSLTKTILCERTGYSH